MMSSSLSSSVLLLLSLFAGIGHMAVVKEDASSTQCLVIIDGMPVEKSLNDTWSLPNEPCLTHACQLSVEGPNNGTAVDTVAREYCNMSCNNEYDLITRPGRCCGECVQTRCRSANGTVHSVGATWKDTDGCTVHECTRTANRVEASAYRKSCPPLPRRCPRSRIVQHDCCQVCASETIPVAELPSARSGRASVANHTFTFDTAEHATIYDPATYLHHPCARDCQPGGAPLVCNYTFIVEWYETLSKACFDCPRNSSDCHRPHCIAGDGMARSIVVINRMMPGPRLQVCLGDILRVDVVNKLMGDSTTMHWHGMHQRETPHMDGVPMVSQCPIGPHTTFRYQFRADHEGTHWWHSHTGVQRSDGALGALIVRRPRTEEPPEVSGLYDFDLPAHTLIVQDWEHVTALAAFNSFHHSLGNNKPKNILINGRGKFGEQTLLSQADAALAEPDVPGAELLPNDVDWMQTDANGKVEEEVPTTTVVSVEEDDETATEQTTEHPTTDKPTPVNSRSRPKRQTIVERPPEPPLVPLEVFRVMAGGRYRFRHINAGFLNCPVEISVDGHNLTVIASDGWYVQPVEVATLVTYAGERFDFVVTANQPIGNYWVRVRGLMDCDERFTKAHQVAVLRYAGAAENEWPSTEWPTYDFERRGLQMNALNRGTGLEESLSVAELTSLHATDVRLLQPQADYKFYVYYDFYDKDNPHFNHPNLYSNADMTTVDTQFIGPQLNRITMKMPSMPLMVARDRLDASTFCNESSLAAANIDCSEEFCECSHVLQVPLNATVELVLVDEGYKYDANHPFHLHGQGFHVVAMERLRPSGITVQEIQQLDNAGRIARRLQGAPIKDTITVPDGGYTIVRFVADNPGYWLFHCHIEFHAEVGMSLVFKVGEHSQMPPVPHNFPQCSSYMGEEGRSGGVSTHRRERIGWLWTTIACGAAMLRWRR